MGSSALLTALAYRATWFSRFIGDLVNFLFYPSLASFWLENGKLYIILQSLKDCGCISRARSIFLFPKYIQFNNRNAEIKRKTWMHFIQRSISINRLIFFFSYIEEESDMRLNLFFWMKQRDTVSPPLNRCWSLELEESINNRFYKIYIWWRA